MEKLANQVCPFCHKSALTLIEDQKDIPYFGKAYLFSMDCSSCKYNKADVESVEQKEPSKYTITVDNEKDMAIRVIKSSTGAINLPQLRLSITPGPASIRYISNIEGILNMFEDVIKQERDDAEEPEIKKRCKNLLKKIWKIKLGDIPTRVIVEDPSGNSAIISNKAKVEKLKMK